MNTIKYKKESEIAELKLAIKAGEYHPNVSVTINNQDFLIPFEYHNNDLRNIAKHYQLPLIQQAHQDLPLKAEEKKYSYYDEKGEESDIATIKQSKFFLLNIDGHLSLIDFVNPELITIFDNSFLAERRKDKLIEVERGQMLNNIYKLLIRSHQWRGSHQTHVL